jgi:hypothetical protein
VPHLKVSGEGGKTRYLPLRPGTNGLINDYLDAAGHGLDEGGARCFVRSATTARADLNGRSPRTAFTGWCEPTRRNSGSRSALSCVTRDRRHRCARSPGQYRQSAGMARAREHRGHAHLRSSSNAAGGQPDVQGCLLTWLWWPQDQAINRRIVPLNLQPGRHLEMTNSLFVTTCICVTFFMTAAAAQLGRPTESRPATTKDLAGKKIC